MTTQPLGETMNNTISFDPKFLSEKVKKDYSDHMTALIREFLQNSIDAGATEVNFTLDQNDRELTVIDNGCGMTEEIMEEALFKIGGSHKNVGAVGGFGSAKLILLFQHEWFTIDTVHDGVRYEVNGEGSSYSNYTQSLTDCPNGTKITIKFTDTWSQSTFYDGTTYDEFYSLNSKAFELLSNCEVPATVSWNNSKIEPTKSGELVRSLDWCNIHMTDCDPTNRAHIRIKGIEMFTIYLSMVPHYITIELTSDSSLNILTTNRDGLKYQYSQELDAIIAELSTDTQSFMNKKGDVIVYGGRSKTVYEILSDSLDKFKRNAVKVLTVKRDQASCINDKTMVEQLNGEISKINELNGESELEKVQTVQTINQTVVKNFIESIKITNNINGYNGMTLEDFITEETVSATEHDFIVEYDKLCNELPSNIDPKKGIIKKYANIAKLYRYSIKYILNQLNMNANIKIGWIISDNVEAKYMKMDNNIYFLINPHKCVPSNISKKVKVKRIFRLALHEITHHLGYDCHNEAFMNKFTELLDIQDDVLNWTTFERNAYEEIL